MPAETHDHYLLLLGLLRMQDMHGYRLIEVIESHFGDDAAPKKPTLYDALQRMTDRGWVVAHEEREGNRPPRRVYSVTGEGNAAFLDLLRADLATYRSPGLEGDLALAFMDALPQDERRELLKRRLAAADEALRSVVESGEHPGSMGLAIEHRHRHLETEVTWLRGLTEGNDDPEGRR